MVRFAPYHHHYHHHPHSSIAYSSHFSLLVQLSPRLRGIGSCVVQVVGPGLGDDPAALEAAALVIKMARVAEIPLVIDADGIRVVANQPDIISGCPKIDQSILGHPSPARSKLLNLSRVGRWLNGGIGRQVQQGRDHPKCR